MQRPFHPLSLSAVAFTTAALLMTPKLASAQTVINPGFEDPGTALGGFTNYTSGSVIGTNGWTVGGNDVFVLNTTYNEPSGALTLTFNAGTGSNALDITGSGNTGANTITQVLAFQPGQFTVDFSLGRINDTGQQGAHYVGASSVSVSLGGLALGTFSNTTESIGSVNYQNVNVPFLITSAGNYALTFTNTTPTTNNYAGLDNISVSAVVPEPSTWALAIGGLGVMLLLSRRARHTA